MKHALVVVRDMVLNVCFGWRYDFFYISEARDWVIDEEGRTIIESLRHAGHLKGAITTTPFGLRNKVLHFGAIGTLLTAKGLKPFHRSNKAVVSWFHVVDNEPRLKHAPLLNKAVQIVHTASENTKERLIRAGVDPVRILIIPLGVDLTVFRVPTPEERQSIRSELNIPDSTIAIGSFQKDGDGWGEGMIPKLIKGPDIFCDAVSLLVRSHPVHVVLTGPARGYVKQRLRDAGIPCSHVYLDNAKDVARYYHALDMYLICSREEGGPKSLLESMASGVPLVSTRVGMPIDVIRHGYNGFLVDAFDAAAIAAQATEIIQNPKLAKGIVAAAQQTIQSYHAPTVAETFYFRIYKNLLQ
jgi:glycosyltransferase involved in cell wall biosynthesis